VPLLLAFFAQRMPARSKRTPADDALEDYLATLSGKTKADKAHGLLALLRHGPELAAREARLVALIEDARARLHAAKRRAGGLGFGDLLRIARDTLRDRPDLARAVREGIDVLLVDEFQDTSRVQRDLVYLLREHDEAAAARSSGASPAPEGLLGHGLFLVGDRKQSIYGFRGADVAVFSRVCAELAGRPAGLALAMPDEDWPDAPIADFVALGESRRSGERILTFVNAFSSRDFSGDRRPDLPPRDFEIAYGPAEHLSAVTPGSGGEVVLIADDGKSPEDADPIVREARGAAREAHLAAAFIARTAFAQSGPRGRALPRLRRARATSQHHPLDRARPQPPLHPLRRRRPRPLRRPRGARHRGPPPPAPRPARSPGPLHRDPRPDGRPLRHLARAPLAA
jgi:ATP-dependent helicase/nuclease subunit A